MGDQAGDARTAAMARAGVDRNVTEFIAADPHMGGRYTGPPLNPRRRPPY
jgi:hypothetical protein